MLTLPPKQALNSSSDQENCGERIKIIQTTAPCAGFGSHFCFPCSCACVHFGIMYLNLTVGEQLLTETNPKVGRGDPTTPQTPLC